MTGGIASQRVSRAAAVGRRLRLAAMGSVAVLVGCAVTPEYRPLEAYLKPPPVGAEELKRRELYELEARYLTGLYNLRQRHLNASQSLGVSEYHNQQCAELLATEIRNFSWPETRESFHAVIRKISEQIEKQHCNETKPRFLGEDAIGRPRLIPAAAEDGGRAAIRTPAPE
jgi:hypothetical protein